MKIVLKKEEKRNIPLDGFSSAEEKLSCILSEFLENERRRPISDKIKSVLDYYWFDKEDSPLVINKLNDLEFEDGSVVWFPSNVEGFKWEIFIPDEHGDYVEIIFFKEDDPDGETVMKIWAKGDDLEMNENIILVEEYFNAMTDEQKHLFHFEMRDLCYRLYNTNIM